MENLREAISDPLQVSNVRTFSYLRPDRFPFPEGRLAEAVHIIGCVMGGAGR